MNFSKTLFKSRRLNNNEVTGKLPDDIHASEFFIVNYQNFQETLYCKKLQRPVISKNPESRAGFSLKREKFT
jgi:hypothetical protein